MNRALLVLLLVMGTAQAQNTLVFTAETTTGTEQVTPVLTWTTTPAADLCTASGDWSGVKLPAGQETLAPITSSATYNITCEWTDDSATLSWTAPTQNTDGTDLTDLAGFKLKRGLSPGGPYDQATIDIPDPNATSHVDGPLLGGEYCYVSLAYNAIGTESDNSNEACKTVEPGLDTKSVGITVNAKPNAPSGMTIQ